jgi:O-antigen ligase
MTEWLSGSVELQTTKRGAVVRSPSRLKHWVAFAFGFFLQLDLLVGGGGEGAAATGGFGFRILDLLSVGAVGLLAIHAMPARRMTSLAVFILIVATMAFIRILEPTFLEDPRTVVLGLHYLFFLFAGLYLAIILCEQRTVDRFCWGLVLGLVATLPIFVIMDAGYGALLVRVGLVPGYHQAIGATVGAYGRYSGMWGHPNEAGHIAALSAAGGAYFAFVRQQRLPLFLTAGTLLAIFYFTQSRGGLIAGAAPLAIAFLLPRGQKIDILRLLAVAVGILAVGVLMLQFEFIGARFQDAQTADNVADRFSSILFGIETALNNPFGLSNNEFSSIMAAGTGGVTSPHNGFLFFAAIFGVVPFVVLIVTFAANLRIRDASGAFFFLWTVQVGLSMMFEQLPQNHCYGFVLCTMFGMAFLRTRIGNDLRVVPLPFGRGRPVGLRRMGESSPPAVPAP